MLETQHGRTALVGLGNAVISATSQTGHRMPFNGTAANMPFYVHHFLERVRAEFPRVVVGDTYSVDNLAYTSKGPWYGGLHNFQPQQAGSFTFNKTVRANNSANLSFPSSLSPSLPPKPSIQLMIKPASGGHGCCI